MRIIVQKFGGTSVNTAELRLDIAARVHEALAAGMSSVVVVSAMGRSGEPYATDTLISLCRDRYPETPLREMDLLMSCGEIISSVLVAAALRSQGIDALAMTGAQAGIVTDDRYSGADIVAIQPDHLVRRLEDGKVVVVAGFQGVTEVGDTTTLGRGGSDITAAALGAGLGAEVIEIYTDVDGVKTADPRIVPEARTIDVVGHFEVCQMASEGAKVVHPRAVEIAMRNNVPLRVKSTHGGGPGTLIATGRRMGWPEIGESRPVTAVTHVPNLAQVRVLAPEDGFDPQADLRIFDAMAGAGISVDLINVAPELVGFTVTMNLADRAETVLARQGLKVQTRRGCAKVSVVGLGMRGVPGVMAKVTRALAGERIKILQTADSHATISCLVEAKDMERSVIALHREFQLAQASPRPEGRDGNGLRHGANSNGNPVPGGPGGRL
ncbi:MAG: aspartate kinase [Bacillota bacterium]|nr:aspartate kinase [Bacillota bacterium]